MRKVLSTCILMMLSSSVYASDSAWLGFSAVASSFGYSVRDSTANRPHGYRRQQILAVQPDALTFLGEGTMSGALEQQIAVSRTWLEDQNVSDEEMALLILESDPDLYEDTETDEI